VSGGVVAVDEGEEAFLAEVVADSVAGAEAFGFEAEAGWVAAAVVFDFDVHFGTMFASAAIDVLRDLFLHDVPVDPFRGFGIMEDILDRFHQFAGDVVFFGMLE